MHGRSVGRGERLRALDHKSSAPIESDELPPFEQQEFELVGPVGVALADQRATIESRLRRQAGGRSSPIG